MFTIAAFIDTNIGLVAILMSMLLSPEMEVGAVGRRSVVIRAEDVLLIIVLITWLAKMAIRKGTPLIRSSPLNAPIGLYIAVMLFSTIRAMSSGRVDTLKGMFYIVKYIEYFVLFFIVLNQVTTDKQVKLFLAVLFLTCVVVGIYGNTHIGRVARISAPFEGAGEPNTLGGYLLFVLSILGGMMYVYKKNRGYLFLMFLFLLPTFLFTMSRASYLGMIAALFTFIMLSKDKRVLTGIIALFVLFVVSVSIGPPALKHRVLGTFRPEQSQTLKKVGMIQLGPSPAARVVSWRNVMTKDVPKRPFLGSGITGMPFLDSQFMLVLGETGIVGLFMFLWIMRIVWKSALNAYHNVESPQYKGLALGFMVGFSGLMFHAIGSNTFIIIRIAEPFWFFAAIVIKLVDIETGTAQMRDRLAIHN